MKTIITTQKTRKHGIDVYNIIATVHYQDIMGDHKTYQRTIGQKLDETMAKAYAHQKKTELEQLLRNKK